MLKADDVRLYAGQIVHDTAVPCLVEVETFHGRDEVNTVRWEAKLNHTAGSREIRGRNLQCAKTEVSQYVQYPLRVIVGGVQKEVNIARRTRKRVICDGPSAYHQVSDLMLVQEANKVPYVLV